MDAVIVGEFLIRPAVPKDVAAIARLWQLLVDYHRLLDPELPPATPMGALRYARRLEDQLFNPTARILVAEVDGQLVGYVFGVVVDIAPEMFSQEPSGFLADIFVEESARRSGVGTQLVTVLAEWFQEKGLAYYEWHAAARNPDALEFWRSLGGREVMLRMRADLG
ncbi:MAG: GNAT family N-acetyltransferase [Anaerolineae bacterium]|nr:GNAT family N-acetyltransferase [Anaerolineae bacterium]